MTEVEEDQENKHLNITVVLKSGSSVCGICKEFYFSYNLLTISRALNVISKVDT